MIDPLTTLPDAQSLDALLADVKFPTIFQFDIKNFKNINLVYGDECGDEVLQKFAILLKDFATEHKMSAFRLGDDEFVLLSKFPFEIEKIESLLIAIPEALQDYKLVYQSHEIVIHYHMGISIDHFNTLAKANIALKVAKATDQEYMTYSLFAQNLLDECAQELCNMISNAIEKERVTPYFQPIIDKDGNVVFYEALTRFDDVNNLQSPILFFNLARQFGLYKELLEVILNKIAKTLENSHKTVSINISKYDTEDAAILQMIIEILGDKDIILEVDLKTLEADAHVYLSKLKAQHIKILLDNVLSQEECDGIPSNAVDFIKLHPDIIREVNVPKYQDVIATLKQSGKPMIATGINSKQSYEIAKEKGCDYFQGFLIARPKKEI